MDFNSFDVAPHISCSETCRNLGCFVDILQGSVLLHEAMQGIKTHSGSDFGDVFVQIKKGPKAFGKIPDGLSYLS